MRSSGNESNYITAASRQCDLFLEKYYFSYKSIFKPGPCDNDNKIWISIEMRYTLLPAERLLVSQDGLVQK
jgi:hypothetical protein